MKNILILNAFLLSFMIFGCATNPYTAEESFGCDPGIFNMNVNAGDFLFCIDKNKKYKAEREYQARLQSDPEFRKTEQKRLAQLEKEKREEQVRLEELAKAQAKEEADLKNRRQKAKRAGTSIDEFIYCYGEPEQRQLFNGQDVFWYDDPVQPTFAIFKNRKLISMYVDKETLQDRYNQAQAAVDRAIQERRHQEQMSEQRASRFQQAMQFSQIMNQNDQIIQNSTKPTTTNCRMIYNTLHCTSN